MSTASPPTWRPPDDVSRHASIPKHRTARQPRDGTETTPGVPKEFDWGVLATIAFPANPHRPARTTHLVFGGCWEPQAREYLVSIGLGGVQITTVYTSDTVVRAGAPAEDSDDL